MTNVENITSVPQRIFKQSECQTAKTGHNIQVDNIQSQLLLYPFYTTNAYWSSLFTLVTYSTLTHTQIKRVRSLLLVLSLMIPDLLSYFKFWLLRLSTQALTDLFVTLCDKIK